MKNAQSSQLEEGGNGSHSGDDLQRTRDGRFIEWKNRMPPEEPHHEYRNAHGDEDGSQTEPHQTHGSGKGKNSKGAGDGQSNQRALSEVFLKDRSGHACSAPAVALGRSSG